MSNQRRRERPHRERPRRAGPGLAALATAAFVYVTAETLPVGLLPQLSAGLHVRPGAVGSVALLALSQLAMALAPNYPVVLAARVGCAFAHGVFWSVLAAVAGRLAAPGRAGRATAIVFTGNSLALVLGTPLATALGDVLGWRAATAVVGAAAAVSVAALRATLPPLPPDTPGGGLRARFTAIPAALRSRSLVAVCAVTVLLVTAHFIPYTYIA